jgi:hypothetical protein
LEQGKRIDGRLGSKYFDAIQVVQCLEGADERLYRRASPRFEVLQGGTCDAGFLGGSRLINVPGQPQKSDSPT